MKIDNRWSTAHLRAILKAVAERELEPHQRRRLTIEFVPAKKYVTGEALVGTPSNTTQRLWCRVRLPNHFTETHSEHRGDFLDSRYPDPQLRGTLPLKASLAKVIAHELAHCAGRTNERSMRGNGSRHGWASVRRGDWDWANEFPLEIAIARPKKNTSPKERIQNKFQSLERKIQTWNTKKKRAETYLKKYQKSLRYYEKQLGQMNGEEL